MREPREKKKHNPDRFIANKSLWLDLFSRKSETELTVIETLKKNLLFSTLSPKELRMVSTMVHLRVFEPGEQVFSQFEKGLGMYMIARGSIDIKVRSPGKIREEVLVTTLPAESFFGEIALIDPDNRRSASAYAQSHATLIGFFKPDLIEILERKPSTGVKILLQLSKVLGKRLNETTETLSILNQELEYERKLREKEIEENEAA